MKHKIFIIILAAAFLAPIGGAKASRLWTSGFELNSVANGVEFDENNVTAEAYASTISSAQAHGGTYSNLFNVTSTAYSINIHNITASDSGVGVIFVRGYIYLTGYPNTNCVFMETDTIGGSGFGGAYLDSSGRVGIQYYTTGGSQLRNVLSSALATGQWHRIEFKIDASSANIQVITLYVDGTLIDTYTGTKTLAANLMEQIAWGAFTTSPTGGTISNMYIDDIAVNDNSGSYQNSYPGEGKVIALMPNATGDANSWLNTSGGAGSTTDWGLVDEIPPDNGGGADYIESKTLNQEDLFNVADSGIGTMDTVNVVNVGLRFSTDDAPSGSFKVEVEKTSGGTKYQSSSITPTDSSSWHTNSESPPLTYPITLYQDPDSSAWTKSTLDSMQIGAKCTATATNYSGIPTIWAMVDYTPTYSPVIIRKSAGGPTIFRNNVIFK